MRVLTVLLISTMAWVSVYTNLKKQETIDNLNTVILERESEIINKTLECKNANK